MTDSAPVSRTRWARSVAGLLTLLEALVLLGFVAFYAYELATGASDDVTRALTSGVLILVFAVGLLLLARGWRHAADWPRTPTVLWNVLLLPVAWSLHDSGRSPLGLAVGVVALGGVAAALATPPRVFRPTDGPDARNPNARL